MPVFADSEYVQSALRNHLIGLGYVRKPAVAGAAPPCYLEPAEGTPGPGERQGVEADAGVVVGVRQAPGLPTEPYESDFISEGVDVTIRSKDSRACKDFYRLLRVAAIDRRAFDMGGMFILHAREWRPFSLVGSSTAQGYTYSVGLLFDHYAV